MHWCLLRMSTDVSVVYGFQRPGLDLTSIVSLDPLLCTTRRSRPCLSDFEPTSLSVSARPGSSSASGLGVGNGVSSSASQGPDICLGVVRSSPPSRPAPAAIFLLIRVGPRVGATSAPLRVVRGPVRAGARPDGGSLPLECRQAPPLSRRRTPGERRRAGARGAGAARETGGPLWPPEWLAVPRWGRGGGPGPRDPPTRGNLNLEACWGSGPARRSEWRPRGGKKVNRRPGGGGRRRRAVTPPTPHPCSNKRGLGGLGAWFRPLSGPGGARAGLRQNLDCEPSSGGQHLGASGYPGFRVVLG
ncbi:hypothetical protein NDU88_004774 [Pleurodeles waltl]|uniref:Uncharacterized protein n=1 Tax=Pleurodeles waltl TaxID=8319 RepID=A0AAV7W9J6_PLEWA|nr:hypothetical protein NDU88_004774 [Pleurodeles waltl]